MGEYLSFAAQLFHYFDRPHVGIPTGSITGPTAWTGRDLSDSDEWIEPLTQAQISELDTAVAQLPPDVDLGELTAADVPLPGLEASVLSWRESLRTGRGFVLVRGLPVDRWSQAEAEAAFWTLGLHLGRPGAQNGEDELLGHVTDYGDDANQPMGRQYRTTESIGFHCDAADAVGLLCLRPAREGGASRLVSSVTVFNILREEKPELVERLFEDFALDARQDGDGSIPYLPVTPCAYDGATLRTFMHCSYFRSVERHEGVELSQIDRATLDAWEEIAERPEVHLDMDFGPGDVQLVSNHTVTHARTGYVDHDDPARKRHLLRLWLSL